MMFVTCEVIENAADAVIRDMRRVVSLQRRLQYDAGKSRKYSKVRVRNSCGMVYECTSLGIQSTAPASQTGRMSVAQTHVTSTVPSSLSLSLCSQRPRRQIENTGRFIFLFLV